MVNNHLSQLTIDGLVEAAHGNARNHGFYEGYDAVKALLASPDVDPTLWRSVYNDFMKSKLFGIVTEPAEASRELRQPDMHAFLEELADVVIRVFDFAGFVEEDHPASFGRILLDKMAYNEGRPKYHGHQPGSA